MSKTIAYWRAPLAIAAGLLLAGSLATAQETPKAAPPPPPPSEAQAKPASVYRMDFVVRELENSKRINSRSYSLSGTTKEGAGLRVTSRVPTAYLGGEGKSILEYRDVGINIDCVPEEMDNSVLLMTRFASSSVVPREPGPNPPYDGPVIREVKFNGKTPVILGKPMVIATLDDAATNRRFEIEVTVTKVK
jgi:hypothetical protein